MRFYAVFRISSLPIPLVNLTDLCKKFGTRWHMCAKTCAKSTIFQICLFETILNGNNLNYIYNFHKFKLFPIVSVLLSSIWAYCSYFPMQHVELFNYESFTLKTVENFFHLLGGRKIRHFCRSNVRSLESWKNWVSHPEVHLFF